MTSNNFDAAYHRIGQEGAEPQAEMTFELEVAVQQQDDREQEQLPLDQEFLQEESRCTMSIASGMMTMMKADPLF